MSLRRVAVLAAFLLPLTVVPTASAGCGFMNNSVCPQPPVADPGARVPGTPVAQVKQVGKATAGAPNAINGNIRPTKVFGTPDAGVVPVVGAVDARADNGSYVMYESRVDERTIDLMVWSVGLQGPAPVRVQLPPSWGTDKARTYPGLFLLHGGAEPADYQAWSVYSQFKQRVGNLEALVVMPSSGIGGHTTDYVNFGYNAGKQYGTFVRTELMQILHRGYALGEKSAVAGVSAGARSALEVAYKDPADFVAAGSYSGLLDTQILGIEQSITLGPASQALTPFEMWGHPYLNRNIWEDRNPTRNLTKLRAIKLFVSAGDGAQGPLDRKPIADVFEAVVAPSTASFIRAAKSARLDVTAFTGEHGTHRWPYFDREFGRSLPTLLAPLGLTPQAQPEPFKID
ncbi:MAG: alpha/beta hydrolase-fold protein [Solirubrobacteraceae bacterium]|nr:alpha/beta hydrolase-fold protein [Solirubrobacteraceae bacterium]